MTAILPYSTPSNDTTVRLYDAAAVSGANFLGSPVAGSVLLALNYRRLGRPAAALASIALGMLATLTLILLAYAIPMHSGAMFISMVPVLLMNLIAQRLQGSAVKAHCSAGGKVGSRWKAAGVGLLALVIIFGVLFTYFCASSKGLGKRIAIGTNDEIYYRDGITENDAKAVGQLLLSEGFFTGRGVTVMLAKEDGAKIVSFVVADGIWDKESSVAGFEKVGQSLAPTLGGLPMKVRLLDTQAEVKKEMNLK